MANRGTFLSQQMWKTVPWEDDLPSKGCIDYLVDIFCGLPQLLAETDARLSRPDRLQGVPSTGELRFRASCMLTELREWRKTWDESFPHCYHEVPPEFIYALNSPKHGYHSKSLSYPREPRPDKMPSSCTAPPPKSCPFDTFIYYSDLWRAYELCLYNVLQILTLRTYMQLLKDAEGPIAEFTCPWRDQLASSPDEISLYFKTTTREWALEICRSMQYMLLDRHGSITTFFILVPARVAYDSLNPMSQEAAWLAGFLKDLSDNSGFGVSRNALRFLPNRQMSTSTFEVS